MPRKSFSKGTYSKDFLASLLALGSEVEITVLDHGTNQIPQAFEAFFMKPSIQASWLGVKTGNAGEGEICNILMNLAHSENFATIREIDRRVKLAARQDDAAVAERARIERQSNSPFFQSVCRLFGDVRDYDHTENGLSFGVEHNAVPLRALNALAGLVNSTDIDVEVDYSGFDGAEVSVVVRL